MAFTQIENRKESLAMTTALFVLLFLIFFFLKFSNITDMALLEGGGGGGEVAVNFGDSDFGSGENYASMESVKSTPKPTPQPKAADKEILASESDDAPVIANVKKATEKPKKVEEEKPVVKPAPKPSKSTSDALSNLLNGSSTGGDGNDKQAGNKGKSNGDANALNLAPAANAYEGNGAMKILNSTSNTGSQWKTQIHSNFTTKLTNATEYTVSYYIRSEATGS